MGKALRVDHVNDYKPPKDHDDMDDETRQLHSEGCAPKLQLAPEHIKREKARDDNGDGGVIVGGIRLPPRLPIDNIKQETNISKKVNHIAMQPVNVSSILLKFHIFTFLF